MTELKFTNLDAKPKTEIVKCRKSDVAIIMSWYGSHHAGDRYSVHVDGKKVAKDQNGELLA